MTQRLSFIILILTVFIGIAIYPADAELLDYTQWKKHENVYRPYPVLFLHGFAGGNPGIWQPAIVSLDREGTGYFSKYYGYSNPDPKNPFHKDAHLYLETISFFDTTENYPAREDLIDRNSSVDTYQPGDYYVETGERIADGLSDPGWADKVAYLVAGNIPQGVRGERLQYLLPQKDLLQRYGTDKLILVCHSTGGLT